MLFEDDLGCIEKELESGEALLAVDDGVPRNHSGREIAHLEHHGAEEVR